MLTQEYTYYLYKVFASGLLGIAGLVTLILLIVTIAVWFGSKQTRPNIRAALLSCAVLLTLAAATSAFYTGVYEYDEHPDLLAAVAMPQGAKSCGSGWTGWAKGGYGLGNPCPETCYRGITLRKQLKMTGFPPWPNYRRELQCWTYSE